MNLNISLISVKRITLTFLHRFHIVIFVAVVLVGLIFIIYMLYDIVIKSTDTSGVTPKTTSATFDQDTIKRINELKTREQSSGDLDLSQGRTNPFVE